MATMFEKGQSKRYSRVSYGMSGGGEAKKRSKDDDKSEAAEANPYGSTKALDEATNKMRRGGMAESKKMMRKEVAFMKKKKAPKSMIAHEKAEMKGEKKYALGGALQRRVQENMAKGRAATARTRTPKARPMPNPRGPGALGQNLPRSRNPRGPGALGQNLPRSSNPRTPKARPMPNPRGPGAMRDRGAFGRVNQSLPTSTRTPKSRSMPRPANPRPSRAIANNRGPMVNSNRPTSTRTPKARPMPRPRMKTGGKVKGYYKGGSVDGCVTKGRTKGKIK